jgi:hypothetical protein
LNTVGRMGYKNPSFYTDFKNVHLTFVRSAPKQKKSGTFFKFFQLVKNF